jgi:protein tyrosine phosphatase (PTP) superfamily phosphohydrolase (DUF442 family)
MKQAKQQYRSLNSEESWTAFTAVQQCSVQEQTVKANESYTAQADCAVLTQYSGGARCSSTQLYSILLSGNSCRKPVICDSLSGVDSKARCGRAGLLCCCCCCYSCAAC